MYDPRDFGSNGNHMIMTSLETMTNAITNSNVSKITAAITLQIMFQKGRCHGDILRTLLYPRHLCRGVYSFRLSVRPFVCSYVRSFVCSFVRSYFLPSRGICVKVLR